jgi:Amino acid synthesis
MKIRSLTVISQEISSEGGRELAFPTKRVAACAVLHNPFAGKPPIDDFTRSSRCRSRPASC